MPIPNGNVTLKQQRDQKQTEDMINVFSYGIQSIIDSFITLLNILGWVIKNPIKSGFLLIYQLPGYVILEVDDNKTGNFFSLYFSYKALLISSGFWLVPLVCFLFYQIFKFLRQSNESKKRKIVSGLSIFKSIVIRMLKIMLMIILLISCILIVLHAYSLLDEQPALHISKTSKYIVSFLNGLVFFLSGVFELLTLFCTKVFIDFLNTVKELLAGI